MICHRFKGGIGTASRRVVIDDDEFTLAVLVQANYGVRETLTIAGVPVGREITDLMPEMDDDETGSIIVIVACDAPLLPHQLKRIARRVPMGMAKVGGLRQETIQAIFLSPFQPPVRCIPATSDCHAADVAQSTNGSTFRGHCAGNRGIDSQCPGGGRDHDRHQR